MTIFTRLMVNQVGASLAEIIRVEESQLGLNGNRKSVSRLFKAVTGTFVSSDVVNNDPLTTHQLAELALLKERVLLWSKPSENDQENLQTLLAWIDQSIEKIKALRPEFGQLPATGKVFDHLTALKENIQRSYNCLERIKDTAFLDAAYNSESPKAVFLYHTALYFVKRIFSGKKVDDLLETKKAKAILDQLPGLETRYKENMSRENQIEVVTSTVKAVAATNQQLCKKKDRLFTAHITGISDVPTQLTLSPGRLARELNCILEKLGSYALQKPALGNTVFTHIMLSKALAMVEKCLEREKGRFSDPKSVVFHVDYVLTSRQMTELELLKERLLDLLAADGSVKQKDPKNKFDMMALVQTTIARIDAIRKSPEHNQQGQGGETQKALNEFRTVIDKALLKLQDCSTKVIPETEAMPLLDRAYAEDPMTLFYLAACDYLISETVQPEGGDAATRDQKEKLVIENLRRCAKVIQGDGDPKTVLANVRHYLGLIESNNKVVSESRQPKAGVTVADVYVASAQATVDTHPWALGRLLLMVTWARRMLETFVGSPEVEVVEAKRASMK